MQLYPSKNMPNYMLEFIDFATEYLGIDRLRGDLHIDLKQTLEDESFGLCWGDKREAEIQIASRQFDATGVTRENKLKTLAHELTHAYQYLTGELVAGDVGDFMSTWQGDIIPYTPETDNDTPWEVEAHDYEERIYEAWMNRKV